MMDERYGKVGTPEREAFRKAAIEQVQLELASTAEREQARPKVKEAYAYCVGQIISDVKQVPVPCVFNIQEVKFDI